jgi:hypothetical protein
MEDIIRQRFFLVRGMGKEQTIFDALWQFCCKKEEVFSVIE